MYIKSATSGNLLPAYVIRTSKIRAFFGLASLYVIYYVNSFGSDTIRNGWFLPEEVYG